MSRRVLESRPYKSAGSAGRTRHYRAVALAVKESHCTASRTRIYQLVVHSSALTSSGLDSREAKVHGENVAVRITARSSDAGS